MKPERWFLKCRNCNKPWAIDISEIIVGYGGHTIRPDLARESSSPCPHCGCKPGRPHRIMGKVTGKYYAIPELHPACDGRCTNAKGPNCDCSCHGKNHGSQAVIEKWTISGRAPKAKENN